MKKLIYGVIVFLVLVISVVAILRIIAYRHNMAANAANIIANQKTLDEVDRLTGKRFPEIGFLDYNKNIRHLSEYGTKVIFLDFWHTQCGPCIEQHPSSAQLQKRFKNDTSVVFINIAIQENFDDWKQFISSLGVAGINLFLQRKGVYTGKEFGVNAFPTYGVLGLQNKILGWSTLSMRPGIPLLVKSVKLGSNIEVDWILLQARKGISAKESLIKLYNYDSEYASWDKDYKSNFPDDFR